MREGLSPRGTNASSGSNAGNNHARHASGAVAIAPDAHPLLQRMGPSQSAAAQPRPNNRQVHRHAMANAQVVRDTSPSIFFIYVLSGICELIAAIVILIMRGGAHCNKPLALWISVYCARWFILIPIAIKRFRERDQLDPENPDFWFKVKTWIELMTFIWWIFGQYWFFQVDGGNLSSSANSACDPILYKFAFILIVIYYIRLFLPLMLLFMLCLCLPFALLVIRIFSPSAGASPAAINSLPTKKFTASTENMNDDDKPGCAICMDDFKENDELRVMPCNHEFHTTCVDRWLAVNQTCPLCRASILGGEENNQHNDNRV